ncbi:hypothetical protein NEUTE1DRAFT_13908, partial [Neurospora tetrasperma FGSC 2508]
QFPLIIIYTITIYKVQSSTLNIVILNISKRDFQIKFIYVVYNRIKILQSFIFDTPFDLS